MTCDPLQDQPKLVSARQGACQFGTGQGTGIFGAILRLLAILQPSAQGAALIGRHKHDHVGQKRTMREKSPL